MIAKLSGVLYTSTFLSLGTSVSMISPTLEGIRSNNFDVKNLQS
jgi:hypothetical protein